MPPRNSIFVTCTHLTQFIVAIADWFSQCVALESTCGLYAHEARRSTSPAHSGAASCAGGRAGAFVSTALSFNNCGRTSEAIYCGRWRSCRPQFPTRVKAEGKMCPVVYRPFLRQRLFRGEAHMMHVREPLTTPTTWKTGGVEGWAMQPPHASAAIRRR